MITNPLYFDDAEGLSRNKMFLLFFLWYNICRIL